MLTLENVGVTLGKGTALERPVLTQLNLTLHPGEFVVVIGGNGAGKSTLFNAIAGLTKMDEGSIHLGSLDMTDLESAQRCQHIALVMQNPSLGTVANFSIYENMAFALGRAGRRRLRPFSNRGRRQLFQDRLSLLGMGLEDRLDVLAGTLSGGQRQALSLAMAFLTEAPVILLDEITAALDPVAARRLVHLADGLVRQEKRACLMITHDMQDAAQLGDRTLVLQGGAFIKEIQGDAKKRVTPQELTQTLMTGYKE